MQNEFITALGLTEWDEKVTTLLEKYHVPEVDIDEDADGYFRFTKDNLIRFSFDKECKTPKQKIRKAEENFYLNHIEFNFDLKYYKKDIPSVDIPFGIDEKSDYASVLNTIGEPQFERERQKLTNPYLIKYWLLKKDDGELYGVSIYFKMETLKVHTMALYTYDDETKDFGIIPHSYDPLKR